MNGPLRMLLLGACNLHGPLNPEAQSGQRIAHTRYGRVPGVYTFGEIFQAIAVLRGERQIPDYIKPLCSIEDGFSTVEGAGDFSDIDVVLVEPASPIDIEFRGCFLNRASMSHLVLPIQKVEREATKHFNRWYRMGIMDVKEEVRAASAEALMKFVPDDMKDPDLARAVILETRSRWTNVAQSLRRLKDDFGDRLAMVNFIFSYLPDGRAVSWPAGFHDEIEKEARKLDLPLFQPGRLVQARGVDKAMKPDLRHYAEEFLPVMADAMLEFAHGVATASTAARVKQPA